MDGSRLAYAVSGGGNGLHEGLRLEREDAERRGGQRQGHVRRRLDQHRRRRHRDRRCRNPAGVDREPGRKHRERRLPLHLLPAGVEGAARHERDAHRKRRRHVERELAGRARRRRRSHRAQPVHDRRDRGPSRQRPCGDWTSVWRRSPPGSRRCRAVSLDQHRIAVLRADQKVALYDSDSGRLLLTVSPSSAREVVLRQDYIVVLTRQRTLEIFNARTGAPVRTLPVSPGAGKLDVHSGIAAYAVGRNVHVLQAVRRSGRPPRNAHPARSRASRSRRPESPTPTTPSRGSRTSVISPSCRCAGRPPRSASSSYWLAEPRAGDPPSASQGRARCRVVGGGVTGCAAALRLAEAGLKVRLHDAREIAGGASGRNGGFALRGGAAPFDVTAEAIGHENAVWLWRETELALDRLEELAGDAFARTGSLRLAADDEERVELAAELAALRVAGFEAEWIEEPLAAASGRRSSIRPTPPSSRPAACGGWRCEPPRPASRSASTVRSSRSPTSTRNGCWSPPTATRAACSERSRG